MTHLAKKITIIYFLTIRTWISCPVKEFQTFKVMLFTAVITELSWRSHATIVTFNFVILSSTPWSVWLQLMNKNQNIRTLFKTSRIFKIIFKRFDPTWKFQNLVLPWKEQSTGTTKCVLKLGCLVPYPLLEWIKLFQPQRVVAREMLDLPIRVLSNCRKDNTMCKWVTSPTYSQEAGFQRLPVPPVVIIEYFQF